ncbi:hypothetical protein AOLI_G00214880 [Acnodon oligacanthus]
MPVHVFVLPKDHSIRVLGDGSSVVTPPHVQAGNCLVRGRMDESTFEMFEEELGTPLQDVHPQKPVRQTHRTEKYTQRRVREEPPIDQKIPKAVPCEPPVSRTTPLRKTLSLQNVAQIEMPWEGVTLNRCLFIAITILVLTSGCQRLNEVVRGRKDGTDVDGIGTALNVRHTLVRKGRLPLPQPETSLWDTFFWWVSDDNDEEEEGRRGRSRKVTQERASRGLRHKAIPNKNLLKGRQDTFKAHSGDQVVFFSLIFLAGLRMT